MNTMMMMMMALVSGPAMADAAKGATLYQANCSACHGAELDGNGPAGAALQPKPVSFKDKAFWASRDDKAIKASIKNGKPGTAMMAFAHLPDADIDAIVAYMRANQPK
ncbi:MAG: c-type cytochrome [Myxococcota bacterium]